MNILHISQIGALKEGIGSVLYKLIPYQERLGNKVKIISVYKNEVYPDMEIEQISTDDEFSAIIDLFCPDIVIFHSVYYIPYIHFYKILLKNRIPYLIQMHGALSQENYAKGKFKKWVANKLCFNRFLKNAKAIIYLNEAERNNCIVYKVNRNSLIIPNGCDRIQGCAKNDMPQVPIDIIYIGRIDMIHKGNDKLIEAIEILKAEEYNKCKISVYANPNDPDLSLFKNKIVNLDNYIEYKGGIYGDDKEKRLREADIFILTSRYEGMPMGVLEALSYGIPCIVTPGTNMAEVIEKASAGWVATFDSSQIARTIKIAVEQYSCNHATFRENAKLLSFEYDWLKIAEDSVKKYRSYILDYEK